MVFSAYEVHMSHWILEPIVIRTRDAAEVLSLDGSAWDGGGVPPTFPAPGQVELHLRHYPDGSRTYDLVVDVEAERCWLAGAEDRPAPVSQAKALVEGRLEQHVEETATELLDSGFCPYCQAPIYLSRLERLLRPKTYTCPACDRTWELPGR